MKENKDFKKSGYLKGDFKLFHLKDTSLHEFDFHYHDFYKVLLFLSGNVSYIVEGRRYELRPHDIMLVNAGEIHKPIIHDTTPYERIILYLAPQFFEANSSAQTNLFHCFETIENTHSNLIRLSSRQDAFLHEVITALTAGTFTDGFGSDLYQKLKILEFLLLLNHSILHKQAVFQNPVTAHPLVLQIMEYINTHLTENLSIDAIADAMFLNRSYIMHLFKEQTGYTIGKYISEKRLFLANQYRSQGYSITEACYKSGFNSYSSFYHAYRKKYGNTSQGDVM